MYATPLPDATAAALLLGCVWTAVALLFAVRFLRRAGALGRASAAFRRLPSPARFAAVLAAGALVLYGGTKPGADPLGMLLQGAEQLFEYLAGSESQGAPEAPAEPSLSESQWLAGFALSAAATNEAFDLSAPPGATVYAPWRLRGASEDGFWCQPSGWTFPLGTGSVSAAYASSSGTLSFGRRKSSPVPAALPDGSGIDFLAPLQTLLGVAPEANWHLLSATNSLFWHDTTETGSARFTWRNVLLGRAADAPVSFQAELFPSGDFVFRYDLSALPPGAWPPTNAPAAGFAVGAQRNGGGETALLAAGALACAPSNHVCAALWHPGAPDPVATPLCEALAGAPRFSLRWTSLRGLDPAVPDPDGDGLPAADEVLLHHTDPRLADTDGDGHDDAEETADGTDPRDPDEDRDGVPDGVSAAAWATNPLWAANAGTTNLVLTLERPPAEGTSALVRIGDLRILLATNAVWRLGLSPAQRYGFLLHVPGYSPVRLRLSAPEGDASAFLLHDPSGAFAGTDAGAGEGWMSFPELSLETVPPGLSPCLHGEETERHYAVGLVPEGWEASRQHAIVVGFVQGPGSTLALSAAGLSPGEAAAGTVSFEPPWLAWGRLSASASVHLCEGARGAFCFACGLHHADPGACGHAEDCAARLALGNPCTCPPRFVRVNSDDDDLDGTEDRGQVPYIEGEDDLAGFPPLPFEYSCCCADGGSAHVKIVSLPSGLRLWDGGAATLAGDEVPGGHGIAVEAVAPSPTLDGFALAYEIHDPTNGLARSLVRRFVAANAQILPDFDDGGTVDAYDASLRRECEGGPWLLPRRQAPYRIDLQNECPADALLYLRIDGDEPDRPGIKAAPDGAVLLRPHPLYNEAASPPLCAENVTTTVWLDASGPDSTATLTYNIQAGGPGLLVEDSLTVRIVDTAIPERWLRPGGTAAYDFTHATENVWWHVFALPDWDWCGWGYGGAFSPGADLPLGDYVVEAYFEDILEGGYYHYSAGLLHVADTVLEREVYLAQCGTDARTRVALDTELSSPVADWRIEPLLPDGARLFGSESGGAGAASLDGLAGVWVSAGVVPTNYTVTATHPDWTEARDTAILCSVGVEVVVDGQYADPMLAMAYFSNEPGRKWVMATFPEPVQPCLEWRVRLHGISDGLARFKYQRGNDQEQEIVWSASPASLRFTDGWLESSVRLNDGPSVLPEMTLAEGILTISGVQQGDRIVVEESTSNARDHIAVVKNFSWNDLQRLGIGNLELAPEYGGLHIDIKEAILDTIVFSIDPRETRAQKPQLSYDSFPDSGRSTIIHPNFHVLHPELLQLNIPSCRSIGMYPWDYDHWHMGLEVEELPVQVLANKANLEAAARAPAATFSEFLDNTAGKLTDLLNSTHADDNISFLLSHTYESGHGRTAAYVDPTGVSTLKPGDPIRSIRWDLAGNGHAVLSFPGQEDTSSWVHDPPDPATEVWQVECFVNRLGKVVLIGSDHGMYGPWGTISDALREM